VTSTRQFGKLIKATWGRDAWRSLSTDAQWLYAYLTASADTDTAGHFTVHVTKWAKGSPDMTVARVEAAATELATGGWVALDLNTLEGLLRNSIRDDSAGDLVFKGALKRCLLVQSVRLRAVLLAELRELKCERPIVRDDQLSLITDLESSIPPGVDVESVVGFVPASAPPSSSASPQPFARRPNAVGTPLERRSAVDGQQTELDRRSRS
jgi:hypothetical protein